MDILGSTPTCARTFEAVKASMAMILGAVSDGMLTAVGNDSTDSASELNQEMNAHGCVSMSNIFFLYPHELYRYVWGTESEPYRVV